MSVQAGVPRRSLRWAFEPRRLDAPGDSLPSATWVDACAHAIPLIQLMASSLRVDQSLATAVRFAADHLDGPARQALARLDWAVRTRAYGSVEAGMRVMADEIGRVDRDLRRALLCLLEAESEPTRDGMDRRLDRAYDIVLGAEERRAERLSRSVERPLTTLFGLGIVLPLVLVSLYPMLQVSMPGFGPASLALILVVALPVSVFLAACQLLDRNGLGEHFERSILKLLGACAFAPTVSGACGWAAALTIGVHDANSALFALVGAASAAGAAAGWALSGRASAEELATAGALSDLPEILHATGSRMIAGKSVEQSLFEAVESRRSTVLASRLRVVLFDVVIGRRSIEQALARSEEWKAGEGILPALRLVAAAATQDSSNAGRVTLQLAEFARRRQETAESMRSRLVAIAAQIRTTAVGFAPVILGITAGMFGLLGQATPASLSGLTMGAVAGQAGPFAAVVALFLSTQVVTADWLAARLLSPRPATTMGHFMAIDVAVAMGLFITAFLASSALF